MAIPNAVGNSFGTCRARYVTNAKGNLVICHPSLCIINFPRFTPDLFPVQHVIEWCLEANAQTPSATRMEWLQTGFGLVIGCSGLFDTTHDYTSQITVTHTLQCSVTVIASPLGTASIGGRFPSSGFPDCTRASATENLYWLTNQLSITNNSSFSASYRLFTDLTVNLASNSSSTVACTHYLVMVPVLLRTYKVVA
jgi:hypothetical protein